MFIIQFDCIETGEWFLEDIRDFGCRRNGHIYETAGVYIANITERRNKIHFRGWDAVVLMNKNEERDQVEWEAF